MYNVFRYFFPRHLLCRHFWTEEQRVEFAQYYLKHRLPHMPKILHYLEKHSRDIKDPGHKRIFNDVLLQVRIYYYYC